MLKKKRSTRMLKYCLIITFFSTHAVWSKPYWLNKDFVWGIITAHLATATGCFGLLSWSAIGTADKAARIAIAHEIGHGTENPEDWIDLPNGGGRMSLFPEEAGRRIREIEKRAERSISFYKKTTFISLASSLYFWYRTYRNLAKAFLENQSMQH